MKKKTIVITGGANGIGKSISLLYLNPINEPLSSYI